MKVSVLLPPSELALLSALVGKSLEAVRAGVVSAALTVEGEWVECTSEERTSTEATHPFVNVSRLAVRSNPQRLYEADAAMVASALGEVQSIWIGRTAILLSQTAPLQAIPLDEEEPADAPAFSYRWHHPHQTAELGSGPTAEVAEADVGILLQTASGKGVWIYAPFGPYVGALIHEPTAGAVLPDDLANVVELLPLASRLIS